FPSEKLTRNIREATMRQGVEHPVVNDAGFSVWDAYTVRAWPTVILIDPAGRVISKFEGEIEADQVAPEIEGVIRDFDEQGKIDRSPIQFRLEAESEPQRLLNFPSKILLIPGNRLFIADSGHHRLLDIELDHDGTSGRVRRVFGTGNPGLTDGDASAAQFNDPHGMSYWRGTVYLADTGNHALRAIDVDSGVVRTVAGTGQKGSGRVEVGQARGVALRSPWAVWAEGDAVLVALAGSHQIGVLMNEREIGPFAGNGREALTDGTRQEASFNQPSDLAIGFEYLFVADAEASAIRAVTLADDPKVFTLVGQGLFDFGDVDGLGPEVRLQHPTGITFHADKLYVADTYNHKIKTLDPTTGRTETIIGTGSAGTADGPFRQAELYEPEGLTIESGLLYIADTNNHAVRVANLDLHLVETLAIRE
ncbi:MAG: alkyl hydroperoxide reductase, partial [Acidobacteriota bacterium]